MLHFYRLNHLTVYEVVKCSHNIKLLVNVDELLIIMLYIIYH